MTYLRDCFSAYHVTSLNVSLPFPAVKVSSQFSRAGRGVRLQPLDRRTGIKGIVSPKFVERVKENRVMNNNSVNVMVTYCMCCKLIRYSVLILTNATTCFRAHVYCF
jgi:hypothetical protein